MGFLIPRKYRIQFIDPETFNIQSNSAIPSAINKSISRRCCFGKNMY